MNIEKAAGIGFGLWVTFVILINCAWMSFLGWVIYVLLAHFHVI